MSIEAKAEVPRLPRSGLEFRDGVLTCSFQDKVFSTHDLRAAENLRFEKGLHWPSLKVAAVPVVLAAAAKLLIPYASLGWLLFGLLLLAALPVIFGAWGESLCFEVGGKPIRIALVGTAQEISGFHSALSVALEASCRDGATD